MGNVVSSSAKLAPISFASTLISLLTFPTTLLTLLKVVWQDLSTIRAADYEITDYLGNVKQSLYEEKAHLRLIRRRHRGQFDEGAFFVLANSVRHMIRDFKALEDPFLDHPRDYYDREGKYDLDKADPDDYYDTNYRSLGLQQRILWLRRKGRVVEIESRLARLQTRRVAKQLADLAV
ncbi:MAG: hypothetical protein Q9159_003610 [Coniocarpon cinnabarinum]